MKCPRCNSKAIIKFYDEIICVACSQTIAEPIHPMITLKSPQLIYSTKFPNRRKIDREEEENAPRL